MSISFLRLATFSAYAIITPQSSFAQESATLDIIVTAKGLSDAPGDRAFAITTLDALDPASGRVESALRDVAGLAQFRRSDARSANPTAQGLNLRGLGGNASGRVLVLLDGVPQSDPFAGHVNWPLYRPEQIGRVRVTRGGGSGAGGSGALTGTVAIESIGASGATRLLGTVTAGSFNSVDGRALISGRLGQGFALLSVGFADSKGFVPVIESQRGVADRTSPFQQASVSGRVALPIGQGEVQAALTLFSDQRERGTDFSRNVTRGADASLRFVGKRASLTGYVQLRQFRAQFAAVNAIRTQATPTLDQYNTPGIGVGLIGEVRPVIGPVELRLGGEWRHAEGQTNERFLFSNGAFSRVRRAGGASDILGAYGEATMLWDRITLTGGGRIDRWGLSDAVREETPIGAGAAPALLTFPDRSGWAGTGRLGVALTASRTVTLRSAAYLGWRLPTLNELYRPFRVGIEQTNANAALTPERSRGVEIGVDWRFTAAFQLSATAYRMRLDDAIANVTLSAAPTAIVRQRANLAGIESSGVEIDARWRSGVWRASLSAAYADARTVTARFRPAQVAAVQASATVEWRGLTMGARYTGPQFEDDLNSRRLAGAVTLDTMVRVPITEGIAVIARLENMFDARVEAAISATGIVERATPRAVSIGIRFGDWDS
jgi:vitamin B12 transporter